MKTIAPARSVLLALMILTIQLPVTDARAEGVGSYLSTTSSDRPNPSRSELDAPDEWVIVRISVPSFTASAVRTAKEMGFHLATEREPVRGSFDLAVPLGRLGELSTLGWEYRVLREDVTTPRSQSDKPGPPGTLIDPEYHTYEEMTQELASLYATHPEIAFMESLGVSTLEHRVMWGFKISDNVGVNEDEPAVLYVSTHHGCEMIGMEYCLYLINYLLSNYGSDSRVTRWVDETEIWFVPLFNPDGYSAVYNDIDHEWRKNARDTNENGIYYEFTDSSWTADHDGVDLNRNYSFNWELGGSSQPMAYNYRGASPFSEDENKSMYKLATREMFQIAITFHSWGEVVIYPWDIDWNGEQSPDISVISSIADTVGNRIPTQDGSDTYFPYAGSAREGYIDNWIYGDLGTICMTLEVNPWPVFIAPGDSITSICERLFSGTTYLLDRVHTSGVKGLVTNDLTGLPVSAEVRVLEYYADYVAPRMSDETGRYYRLLLPAEQYTLEFIAPGFDTTLITNVPIYPESLTTVNVSMTPTVGINDRDPAGHIKAGTSSIGQNYPNPFNPSTTISFAVSGNDDAGHRVSLMIYDMRGRRIRTLVHSNLAPGTHNVVWDGKTGSGIGVPSGVYFYTLKQDGVVSSRKMTLVR